MATLGISKEEALRFAAERNRARLMELLSPVPRGLNLLGAQSENFSRSLGSGGMERMSLPGRESFATTGLGRPQGPQTGLGGIRDAVGGGLGDVPRSVELERPRNGYGIQKPPLEGVPPMLARPEEEVPMLGDVSISTEPPAFDIGAALNAPAEVKDQVYASFKGQDLDKVFMEAFEASKGTPYDIGAALDKYRKDFAPDMEKGLSKKDKSMLILELGMRMMAGAGKPGASTSSAIGEAGMGTLGTARGMEEAQRVRNRDAEDRAERRAMGALGIDLKGREMEDARLGRAQSAAIAAAQRAAKEDELALKDIEGRREAEAKSRVDAADIDYKRAQIEKIKREVDAGGKGDARFRDRFDTALRILGDEKAALDYAHGTKMADPMERRIQASNAVAKLVDAGIIGSEQAEAKMAELLATEQPAPKGAVGKPKKITTEAEYNALPSGAEYIDPDDGKRYRKP